MRNSLFLSLLVPLIQLSSTSSQSLDRVEIKKHLRNQHIYFSSEEKFNRKLTSNWELIGGIIEGDEAWGRTGYSTALNEAGTRLVVGSQNATASENGAAKVYDLVNDEWQQIGADLTPGAQSALVGYDVDISKDGSVVLISAPFHSNYLDYQGQVFVYSWTGTTWMSIGHWYSIAGAAEHDQHGFSIASSNSGHRIAVGASSSLLNINNPNATAGFVNIWDYVGNNNWVIIATLNRESVDDFFGWDVAISGNGAIVAVGTPNHDAGYANSDSGHVQVYQETSSPTSWTQLGTDISSYEDSWFGITVALSENGLRLAAGGHEADINGVNSGHVVVFDYDSSALDWVQAGQEIYGVGVEDRAGWSVTLSSDGNRLATSAPSGGMNDRGRVNIYDYIKPGIWADAGPPLHGIGVDGKFGYSLSLSGDGNKLAVGTPNESIVGPNTGKATVYEFSSWHVYDTWIQLVGSNSFDGRLKVENEIGQTVIVGNVGVTLFDFNCNNVKINSGLEVSLDPISYSSTPHVYYVDVDQARIGNGTDFVFFDADSNSTGSIKFCTRVSSYETLHQGTKEVAYRETNFDLRFDLTDNGFFMDTTIFENDATDLSTDVQSAFSVGVCQCDNDYTCLSTTQTIEQDSSLVICLEPEGGNDSDVVEITNFNLVIEAGSSVSSNYFSYSPVSFGTTAWKNDVLTKVELKPNTNRIKVSSPITAGFFIQGFSQIRAGGNANLEFVSAKEERSPSFSFFSIDLELAVDDTNAGCFKSLLGIIQQLF